MPDTEPRALRRPFLILRTTHEVGIQLCKLENRLRAMKPVVQGQRKERRIHLLLQETGIQSLGLEDPQEKEMATHSFLAQEIPWTQEPGRL